MSMNDERTAPICRFIQVDMKTNTAIEKLKAMLNKNGFSTVDGKNYIHSNFDYQVKFNGNLIDLIEKVGRIQSFKSFNLLKMREFADRTLMVRYELSKDMPFLNWEL